MYALLMSTINFGSMLSGQLGAVITYYLGVTDTNFDNLWLLVFITNISVILPLILINFIDIKSYEDTK
jgi:hypothetical protein